MQYGFTVGITSDVSITGKGFTDREFSIAVRGWSFNNEKTPLIKTADEKGVLRFNLSELFSVMPSPATNNGVPSAYFIIKARENNTFVPIEGGEFVFALTPEKNAQIFPDVSSGYWAYQSIQKLAEHGVTTGYGDGTFRPDNPVTRMEFVSMLYYAFLPESGANSYKKFTDLNTGNNWDLGLIAKCADYICDIDGKFEGDSFVQRWDLMDALVNIKNPGYALDPRSSQGWDLSPDYATEIRAVFSDIPNSDWLDQYIWLAYKHGIIKGYPDGTFRYDANITRAEAAVMIARAMD